MTAFLSFYRGICIRDSLMGDISFLGITGTFPGLMVLLHFVFCLCLFLCAANCSVFPVCLWSAPVLLKRHFLFMTCIFLNMPCECAASCALKSQAPERKSAVVEFCSQKSKINFPHSEFQLYSTNETARIGRRYSCPVPGALWGSTRLCLLLEGRKVTLFRHMAYPGVGLFSCLSKRIL